MSQSLRRLDELGEVDIAPGISVLGVFPHLNYKPWYAIAELVDNALDSFLLHRAQLAASGRGTRRLHVQIAIDPAEPGRITVSDDAAGIARDDWKRALRPAEPPTHSSGLSQFGMGLKTSAYWFGKILTVESKALGESVRRRATLEFEEIIARQISKVTPMSTPADSSEHGTTITIRDLHRPLQTKTIAKIRDHLRSIYRVFLRNGDLILSYQSGSGGHEPLSPEEVQVLRVPRYDDLKGEPVEWKKSVEIDLGDKASAKGFVALRARGSTSLAGFSLFRFGRLIQGSGDETYRPGQIFGASTTAIYQRLFGEFEIKGVAVSHTKDGFRWEEYEDAFVEKLRQAIDSDPMPLLTQARRYPYELQRKPGVDLAKEATDAVESTTSTIERELPDSAAVAMTPSEDAPSPDELDHPVEAYNRTIRVILPDGTWEITAEFSNDPDDGANWVTVSLREPPKKGRDAHQLTLRMSLRHPFTERYAGVEFENLDLLLRFGSALVLAEVFAKQSGVRQAGEVRRRVEELLTTVFSKS